MLQAHRNLFIIRPNLFQILFLNLLTGPALTL